MFAVVIVFVSFTLIQSSSCEPNNGVDLDNFTKDTNVNELWQLYKTKFNKSYEADEDAKRFNIFTASVKRIAEQNEEYAKGLSSFYAGLNQFADQTQEENGRLFGTRPLLQGLN